MPQVRGDLDHPRQEAGEVPPVRGAALMAARDELTGKDQTPSAMAILMCGWFAGTVMRPTFTELFTLRGVRFGPQSNGSPPAYFDITFQSGTTLRVRVEDVRLRPKERY